MLAVTLAVVAAVVSTVEGAVSMAGVARIATVVVIRIVKLRVAVAVGVIVTATIGTGIIVFTVAVLPPSTISIACYVTFVIGSRNPSAVRISRGGNFNSPWIRATLGSQTLVATLVSMLSASQRIFRFDGLCVRISITSYTKIRACKRLMA
jgi:hypothetical protein